MTEHREPDWEYAACAVVGDSEAFFDADPHARRYARRICGGCRIRTGCGEWAVATQQTGTWGGRWLYPAMYDRARQGERAERRAAFEALHTPAILAVGCTTCKAPISRRCVLPADSAGVRVIKPHKARVELAKERDDKQA